MESANLHHQHQLQDQLVASSSLPNPTYYGVGTNHAWTPNVTLNNNFNSNYDGVFPNPRDSRLNNDILVPCFNGSMVQDLGFHWIGNAGNSTNQSAHDQHLSKIKEELSESFPKFTEMLNSSSSSIEDQYHFSPTSHKKNIKTISSKGIYSNNAQNCTSFGGVAMPSRGNYSQIYPSINISNLNQSPSAISSSLDMNLQALNLLTSSEKYSGSFSQASHDSTLGVFKASPSFGLDHMQQLTHMYRPSCSPTNISPFTNRITEEKRASGLMEANTSQAASKKSRLESRTSCPPFKVRKEKLGDRIAALQQLVAPFGKTDTASVLMEAIGYIKFLHNQIETLSVPYMKSSRNKACRTMQAGSVDDGNEEPKRDLGSRGLSLVPLSCMSYVTGDSGGGNIWTPHNYGGGT
uniref:BHLH domain-containing protein n=1 Tax=Fagus sylvatica TaxID=28930 RepID=A0A2N9ICA9_FAGSY